MNTRLLAASVTYINRHIAEPPLCGIILGSGLDGIARIVTPSQEIAYRRIPHFPRTGVRGHAGMLLFGTIADIPVVVMQGRPHYYEGYSLDEVSYPVRVLERIGVRFLIITAAVGGINPRYKRGDIMLIRDHINCMGANPLRGGMREGYGDGFVDLHEAFDKKARRRATQAARRNGIKVAEGVYAALSGPSYETPAEIKALRTLGADVVGMSVVPETIVARQLGLTVLGIAYVSNELHAKTISHAEVVASGRAVQKKLALLITDAVKNSAASIMPRQKSVR